MNHSPLSSAIKPTLAIFGKANVGKSTLFNALIQKRMSITSHRANTTRQQLQAELILDNQIAITCIDTPGIRLKKGMAYDILKLMHRAISLALESTQLILFVSDALKWTEDDEHLLQLIQKHHRLHPIKKIFWIINKIDEIPTKSQLFKHIEHIHKKYGQFDEVFMISAKKKEGLSQLHQALMNILRPFSEGASPTLSLPEGDEEQTTLFYIKELVREQIYTFCYAEIPYIVEIDVQKHQIKTVAEALWRVTLAVDRPSQKKILIGTAGQQLKKIREATERRLKEILGVSLKIEWFVTVKKDLNASSPSPTVLQVLRSPKPSNSKE